MVVVGVVMNVFSFFVSKQTSSLLLFSDCVFCGILSLSVILFCFCFSLFFFRY